MVGDIYTSTIRISRGNTYDTSSPTQITSLTCDTTATYTSNVVHPRKSEERQKIKELLKKKIIQDMKDKWSEFKQFIKQPPLRPAIQLRGVCFGGRGWA